MASTLPPLAPAGAPGAASAPATASGSLPAIGASATASVDLGKLMGDTLMRLINERRSAAGAANPADQGKIGFDEFKSAVVSLGLAVSEARHIFDHFDKAGTGYIDFVELHEEVRGRASTRVQSVPRRVLTRVARLCVACLLGGS